jgi:hypothetical protein
LHKGETVVPQGTEGARSVSIGPITIQVSEEMSRSKIRELMQNFREIAVEEGYRIAR